ncbi:MAG: macro domain-containing protein [Alphaproteobacteria bacterium]
MPIHIAESDAASNPYLNRITLVHGDIAAQDVDAIVSLLPENLVIKGAINTHLVELAGHGLDDFILENIYQPHAGDIYAVPGFTLPCRNILFAVRPNWKADFDREDKHLVMCVRKAVVLAKCMLLGRIAFPPLASGRSGYGKGRAARLLIQGLLDRIDERFEEVRIVCNDIETLEIYAERLRVAGWTGEV